MWIWYIHTDILSIFIEAINGQHPQYTMITVHTRQKKTHTHT